MRKLVIAATALASLAAPANAANMATKNIARIPTVFINGKIEKGDDQTFQHSHRSHPERQGGRGAH
jgi:hypothetical protein